MILKDKGVGMGKRERGEDKAPVRRSLIRIPGYGLDSLKERKATVDSGESDHPNNRTTLTSFPSSTFRVTVVGLFWFIKPCSYFSLSSEKLTIHIYMECLLRARHPSWF